jgi:DNA-binding CsgD family transcriptional regulator
MVVKRSRGAASGLAALGLLMDTGHDLKAMIRDVPDIVRAALAVDTVGFFWSDEQGNMIDAYVERPYFLSAEVLHSCQTYQNARPGNWPTFTENVLAGPVCGYLIPYQTPDFYRSGHFEFTYANIDAHHILDAVVHDGARPLGCYLLMRAEDRGPFSPEEIAVARAVADATAAAFRAPAATRLSTRMFPAGFVVLDRGGALTQYNLAAHQSLWMLARGGETPMIQSRDDSFEHLFRDYCAELIGDARAGIFRRRKVANRWGAFELHVETGKDESLLVHFLHSRPAACHLAAELLRLEMPPRRMAVAWHILHGRSRKEAARLCGISPETVNEHVEGLYETLGLRSASELMMRFYS